MAYLCVRLKVRGISQSMVAGLSADIDIFFCFFQAESKCHRELRMNLTRCVKGES